MTEKNLNATLRDFMYLDKDRMYSLYSQLFNGVAESMVESISYSSEETQKNRNLEESLIGASVKTQNVILFDHIYNILEDKLIHHILEINNNTLLKCIEPSSIVKVTGYVTIEDYERLLYFMKNYNEIGMAFATLEVKNKPINNDASKTSSVSKNSIEQLARPTAFKNPLSKMRKKWYNKKYEDRRIKGTFKKLGRPETNEPRKLPPQA